MEESMDSWWAWALPRVKQIPNLYYKVEGDGIMILLLYVDDLLLTGKDKPINECKKKLAAEFEMKYLGMMHYFLGLEVW